MKTCFTCGFEGDDSFFRENQNWCKKCCSAYNKEYRTKNKEKIREHQRNHIRRKLETEGVAPKKKHRELLKRGAVLVSIDFDALTEWSNNKPTDFVTYYNRDSYGNGFNRTLVDHSKPVRSVYTFNTQHKKRKSE